MHWFLRPAGWLAGMRDIHVHACIGSVDCEQLIVGETLDCNPASCHWQADARLPAQRDQDAQHHKEHERSEHTQYELQFGH